MTNEKQFLKLKKYTLNNLFNKLLSKKQILITFREKEKGSLYFTYIYIWRADLSKTKKYHERTYIVKIKKGDSIRSIEAGILLLDISLEFRSIAEVIEYLDKNNFVKKSDWITDDFAKAKKVIIEYLSGDLSKLPEIKKYGWLIRSWGFEEYVISEGELQVSKKGLIKILELFIKGKASLADLANFEKFVYFNNDFINYESCCDEDSSVADAMITFDFIDDFLDGIPGKEFTKEEAANLIDALKKSDWKIT